MTPIQIDDTIKEVERLLNEGEDISPALNASIQMLLMVVKLLSDRLGLNSHNSSKPPATDPLREKKPRSAATKKRGGQVGHVGTHLEKVEDPDDIQAVSIDRRTLPRGQYTECGFESRQVFDIRISRYVTEYQAEVLENQQGQRFVAPFPDCVTRPTQYGASVKANAVYMSMFQLIPYDRIQTHFAELFGLPISAGSVFNFNEDAYKRLEIFDGLSRRHLAQAPVLHVDETGINIDGKRSWVHNASNAHWTYISAHAKRGSEAMDEIGILPSFTGLLVHDHWKPYYRYDGCLHVLCNAHHKRELTRAHEQDGQQWAAALEALLDTINKTVTDAGGQLTQKECRRWQKKYRDILKKGELECPPPDESAAPKKKGRLARSKSRNLLERLRDYEADVLRFMEKSQAPYTNNQGERDIRMTKVQQKISGCFRSMNGAQIYCRIRSYLSTCRKNNVGVGEALEYLFAGTWPSFIQEMLDAELDGAE